MEHTSANQTGIFEMLSVAGLAERSGMACDLLTLLARVALVTLQTLDSHKIYNGHTHPRFVESASDAYSLSLAHGVGLRSLPLLERAFPLGDLKLLLPLNER
jgi:hypothetical protein